MLSDLQKRTAQAIVNVFETGAACGDYGRVTLLPGDPGHLTYGRSQTTLASGNLHLLIRSYCDTQGARFAQDLVRYLKRLADRDLSLDDDLRLRGVLSAAGDDPVMRRTQDAFFDRVYWAPACIHAAKVGITTALGTSVVYDGVVHGAWVPMRDRTLERHGSVETLGEPDWIAAYVALRRAWLAEHPKRILRTTVYRMDAFRELIDEKCWDLALPLLVRAVRIDEAVLGAAPAPGAEPARASAAPSGERVLSLRRPMLSGPDVRSVQRALNEHHYGLVLDGSYGRLTAAAVRDFQKAHGGLVADGIVGPATRAALGI